MRDERAGLDAGDRLPDVGLEIGERLGDQCGLIPTSAWIEALNSSSVNVSIPQSVWWMRMISVVPSSRWLIVSERISSSVTTPPALRMTWASPSLRPRIRYTSRRASMHATTARCLAGGSGSGPEKEAAYSALLASSSSVTVMIYW